MADNAEIYVGEEGAKELYRRLKALIPDVPVSSDSWKQWSVDNGSTGESESIYIGIRNELFGRSIAFGYDNLVADNREDEGDPVSATNAILIGHGNHSTSRLDAVSKGTYSYHTSDGYTPYEMSQQDYDTLHGIMTEYLFDAEHCEIFCDTLLQALSTLGLEDPNVERAKSLLPPDDPEDAATESWQIIWPIYGDLFYYDYYPNETLCPIYEEVNFGFYSLLAGDNNVSHHHNSILIGSNNTSLEPDDEDPDTDDDGFLLAIGFENTVGRNYDIAIGHRSYAVGGENLAVHQSSATGFRNIAMVNSFIYGTANLAILESTFESFSLEPFSNNLARNVLIASKVNYDDDVVKDFTSDGSFTDNVFTHSTVDLAIPDYGNLGGFSRNLFLMNSPVDSYRDGGKNSANPFIQSGTATNNILFNLMSMDWDDESPSHIYVNLAFDRNTLLNTHIEGEDFDYVTDNTFIGSQLVLFGYHDEYEYYRNTLASNFTLDSLIYAEFNECFFQATHNIVTQNSVLHIVADYNYEKDTGDIYDEFMSATMNTLVNGAYLKCSGNGDITDKNDDPYWGNGWDYCANAKNNVLFGAYGEGLLGCFSHSENENPIDSLWDYDPRPVIPDILGYMTTDFYTADFDMRDAWMVNSRATVNFGDNFIGSANASFVTGEGNIVCGVEYANIHGNRNLVNNGDGYSHVRIPHLTIDGHENKVFSSTAYWSDYFHDNSITGHHNCLYGNGIMNSTIVGSENDISGFDIPMLTVARVREIQENFARNPHFTGYPRYFMAKESGYVHLYHEDNTSNPPIEWRIFTGKVYRLISGEFGLSQQYLNPMPAMDYGYGDFEPDVDYIRFSGALNDYLNAYEDVMDYGGDWSYYVNGLPTYCAPAKDYGYEDPTLMDNIHIIGRQNHVGPWNVGHLVVGQNNRILTTEHDEYSDFCYSNSLVQGSDNLGMDGSNQVILGNGNVATGHNSIAIGSQLISSQWQTVIGKYNRQLPGPQRTTKYYHQYNEYDVDEVVLKDGKFYECQEFVEANEPWDEAKWSEVQSPDRNAAIFVIGNGYGEFDDWQWQDEQFIHRSNAVEVYADGTIKARRFVSTEDEATLAEGDGIKIDENAETGEVVISIKPPEDVNKPYMLEWDPVNKTVHWVEITMYSPS